MDASGRSVSLSARSFEQGCTAVQQHHRHWRMLNGVMMVYNASGHLLCIRQSLSRTDLRQLLCPLSL
jgi:hypothetical protein